MLGAADAALLRAKSGGRDRVCLYTRRGSGEAADFEGDLAAVGRRFAAFIGLSEAEAAGLVTALAVYETGAAVQDEVQAILGTGQNGAAEVSEVRQTAVEALVYGNERWDGGGYPEGRRGTEIPLVARAFASADGGTRSRTTATASPTCATAPRTSSTRRWSSASPRCSAPKGRAQLTPVAALPAACASPNCYDLPRICHTLGMDNVRPLRPEEAASETAARPRQPATRHHVGRRRRRHPRARLREPHPRPLRRLALVR